MIFKTNSLVLLCRAVLVVLFALSACNQAEPVATDSKLGVSSIRYLRAPMNSRDYMSEDRVNIPVISKLVEKVSKTPKNEDEVLQLFTKMQLPYQHTKLLENAQFQKWASAVAKGYKKNSEAAARAMASTLASQYGDEALAKMIVEAKNVPSTKNIAAKLEEGLTKNWLSQRKTPDALLRALNLDEYGYISLWRPAMDTWARYVAMRKEDPYKLLLAKMRARDSDDIVAGLIGSAKREPRGSTAAQKVEDLLIESWMPRSADDVFKLLKLDTAGTHFFEYPSASTWISYVTKVEGKQADEQMYKVLRASYGDDELAVVLIGQKRYLPDDVAKRLEEIQHKAMLSEGKSAKAMFTSLKLSTAGEKLFESPAFSSWTSYVTKLDARNVDNLMVSALKTTYDADVLAKMFIAAKESADTKTIAGKLEQAQLIGWIKSGKSADDVFKLLKLDHDVDNVLTNPLLSNWVAFVEKLDKNPYSILLAKLKTFELTSTDGKLAEMLTKAKTQAATSVIAGRLEAAQREKWLKEGKTVADVFKLLNLEDEGIFLLYRRVVRTWVAFVNKLDPKNTDKIIVSVLKSYYTDTELASVISHGRSEFEDMAATFEKVVLYKWLSEKKSADDVYNFVLKGYHEQIFKTRDLDTWVSYVTKLDKEDPYKTMWLVLQKHFDGRELSFMVSDAAGSSRTREVGQRLVEQLWLSKSITVKELFIQLNLGQLHSYMFKAPELKTWTSYVTKLDPKNADEIMLSVLQPRYTKKELANLVKAAKGVDETKELATRLEKQLLLSKAK